MLIISSSPQFVERRAEVFCYRQKNSHNLKLQLLSLLTIFAIFGLKYRARLVDLDGVPSHDRDLYAVDPFSRTYPKPRDFFEAGFVFNCLAIVNRPTRINSRKFLVEDPVETAFKTNNTLARL